MKLSAFCLLFVSLQLSVEAQYQTKRHVPMEKVEQVFIKAPDSIQTSIYWYWLYNSISKEGVVKDLEAMKKVGINRAFIGNIAFPEIYNGKVKLFSDEWWDILHTALKTATRLGIEIGIFNSPGWSQSGGPWVKPSQAMRYLSSSEIQIKGPAAVSKKLIKPTPDFQDVKLIAYPAPKANHTERYEKFVVRSKPTVENISNLTDNDERTVVVLPESMTFTLDFHMDQSSTIRSVVIYPAPLPMRLEGDIQVLHNKSYRTLKHFVIDRSNNEMNFGFNQYGPGAIAVPVTVAKDMRIVFTDITAKSSISSIKLSGLPVTDSYIEKTLAKMWQDPFPYWPAYQWPSPPAVDDLSYVINPDQVLDISKYLSADGSLNWQVPAGEWIIERCGMTPTLVKNSPASPEATGLETDKMSRQHIEAHFDSFLGEIIRRIPAEDRKTWKVAVVDSYEAGGQNWSDGLMEKFKALYGYDPLPYLPVMQGKVVRDTECSDRFLWDLRRFVADQLAHEYVAGLRNISHQNGLTTWLENYGHSGFPGEFLQYGGQSDEVSGEFWTESNLGLIENRAASSCAHIYGKRKVSSESFTAGGYSYTRYPSLMKQRLDKYFCEGVNNTLLHVYVQQPDDRAPGINGWFGNEFNRLNTWFYDMDLFLKYIKRCNMLLQRGRYVADIAYFISEDAPKMTGSQDPALPQGYSFDYINAEVIKNRLTVKNGRLVLPDGMSYKILVLPRMESMRPELLVRIKQLVSEGAVVLGPKPLKSPSMQNYGTADAEVRQLASELWGDIYSKGKQVHRYGKGMVIDGMNLVNALKLFKILPDCKTHAADSVLFIHRELKEGSIYFLSNQRNVSINFNPAFRITGKTPELWDATTGEIRDLKCYSHTNATTTIPMMLAPYESVFVIFRKQNLKNDAVKSNYPKLINTVTIKSDWLVRFDANMRGPSKPVLFKELTDWTVNTNDSIKYYSGSAYYKNTFKGFHVKGRKVYLNFGKLSAIAKLKVNGIDLGGVWTAPYRVDISNAIRSGTNTLEIKVVNTWTNRIIGDSRLPIAQRKTWLIYNKYGPDSKLIPSGLLGPVRLEIMTR